MMATGTVSQMRRCACLCGLLILAVPLATGCGGSSDAKRAVDARAEAMRFFPATAPLVALLDTNDAVAEERSALVGSLSGVPVWSSLRANAALRLHDAGIDPARMVALLRDSSDPDGIPTSVLAAGWEGSTDAVPQPLLVVAVSDRPVAMAQLLLERSQEGGR